MNKQVYDEITKHVGTLGMASLKMVLNELIKLGYVTELNSTEFILGMCEDYLTETTLKHDRRVIEQEYGRM